MECYICHNEYQPDPAAVKTWAESGRAFEPTDWICQECLDDIAQYESEYDALVQAEYEALAAEYGDEYVPTDEELGYYDELLGDKESWLHGTLYPTKSIDQTFFPKDVIPW